MKVSKIVALMWEKATDQLDNAMWEILVRLREQDHDLYPGSIRFSTILTRATHEAA